MKKERVLFSDGKYRFPTREDFMLNQAIEDFVKAFTEQDFFEAVKKLGIIEMFNIPDA